MVTITNKLDINPASTPVVVHLSQYDSDFTLVFEVFSSVGVFTMQTGTTASVRGTKSDGTTYTADCTIDGNAVTVTGDSGMTSAGGYGEFEIVLTKSEKVLSADFTICVEDAALDDGEW